MPESASLQLKLTSGTRRRLAFIWINCALPDGRASGAGAACSGLFHDQGAFAHRLRAGGRGTVTAVEASGENIANAGETESSHKLPSTGLTRRVSIFAGGGKAETQYDLIILDPPSFTKTKGGLRDALRGYRELHVRAFKLLSRDGMLATFSCSHHVSETVFNQTIADALVDARRSARRLHRFAQALDHPVLPTLPETEYFKGLLLEMMPGR